MRAGHARARIYTRQDRANCAYETENTVTPLPSVTTGARQDIAQAPGPRAGRVAACGTLVTGPCYPTASALSRSVADRCVCVKRVVRCRPVGAT